MSRSLLPLLILTAASLFQVTHRAVSAPMYTVANLGLFSVDGFNDAGQVVGTPYRSSVASVYQNGTFTALPAEFGYTVGINNSGEIVGNSYLGTLDAQTGQVTNVRQFTTAPPAVGGPDPGGPFLINSNGAVAYVSGNDAYLYQGGKTTDFAQFFPGSRIVPGPLNDAGQLVLEVIPLSGSGQNETTGTPKAYVYQGGKVQAMPNNWNGVLGSGSNAQGQFVGSTGAPNSSLTGIVHAALYQNGQVTDLGTLGGDSSSAYGINSRGQVVGESAVVNYIGTHAFLYQNGTMYDLNSMIPPIPGVTLEAAYRINNQGQIVAAGQGPDGSWDTLLLTPVPSPVPEPGTLTVFVFIGGAIALRGFSHRKS